jgi:hypothetical protein
MCMVAWCGVQGGHSSGNRDRLDSDSDGSEPGDVPDVNTTESAITAAGNLPYCLYHGSHYNDVLYG